MSAALNRLRVPSLVIPGAAKSGTSSLHLYLNQHPDIEMSRVKEPHIYSFAERYARRFDKTYELSYNAIFEWDRHARYRGESSTTYFVSPEATSRLFSDNPNTRLIFVLRDPVDRIVSHYNWLRGLGRELLPFIPEVLSDCTLKFDINNNCGGNYKYYLGFSSYATHVRRYLNYFEKQNILVVTTESLKSSPLDTLNECFDFLGVERLTNVTVTHENPSKPLNVSSQQGYWRLLLEKFSESITCRRSKALPGTVKVYSQGNNENGLYRPTKAECASLVELLSAEVTELESILGRKFNQWRNFVK